MEPDAATVVHANEPPRIVSPNIRNNPLKCTTIVKMIECLLPITARLTFPLLFGSESHY